MAKSLRDIINRAMKLEEKSRKGLDSRKNHLSESDLRIIKQVQESQMFKSYPKDDLDRYTLRQIFSTVTVQPISVCEYLATKVASLIEKKLIGKDLKLSKTLVEAMADSGAGEHGGKDHGMYGVGDGGDESEPKGDADKGVNQDGEQGDTAEKEPKGYMDEADDDSKDADKKMDVEETDDGGVIPDKDIKSAAPDKDKSLDKTEDVDTGKDIKNAVDNADLDKQAGKVKEGMPPWLKKKTETHDDDDKKVTEQDDEDDSGNGDKNKKMPPFMKKESEDMKGTEVGKADDSHASEIKAGTFKSKADDEGKLKEDDNSTGDEAKDASDSPDLDKIDKDGAGVELNKGPADPGIKTESFQSIEAKVLKIIERAGIAKGTSAWRKAYEKGFAFAISARAKRLAEAEDAKKDDEDKVTEQGDEDDKGPEGADKMPPVKVEKNKKSK